MAYENANQDRKAALKDIYMKPDVTIAQMISACQNVGMENHKAQLLAAALRTTDQRCFNCNKKGHLKKDCKVKAGRPSK